jgi:hypothetical protein
MVNNRIIDYMIASIIRKNKSGFESMDLKSNLIELLTLDLN